MGSSVILPAPGQPVTGPDPNFKQGAIPNLVQFKFQHVDPPSLQYIQRDDVLVLQAMSVIANETVYVFIRMLLPYASIPGQPDGGSTSAVTIESLTGPGYVQVIAEQLNLGAAFAVQRLTIPLTEGYLLSVAVGTANSGRRGQTFARVWLNRGPIVAPVQNAGAVLFADYVTTSTPSGWPYGRIISPVEDPGNIVDTSTANPAAGADLISVHAITGRARLAAFKATFTASATVANRFPSFQVAEAGGGNVRWQVQDTVAVTASQVITYSLAPGGTNVRGGGSPIFATMPVPSPEFDYAGVQVNSVTQGIQAGDQWSAILMVTEEWLEGV